MKDWLSKLSFRRVFFFSCALHVVALVSCALAPNKESPALAGAVQFRMALLKPKPKIVESVEETLIEPKPEVEKKVVTEPEPKRPVPSKLKTKKSKLEKKIPQKKRQKPEVAAAVAETPDVPKEAPKVRVTEAQRVTYESLLLAWIEQHKSYPRLARRRLIEGDGIVRIKISKSGEVLAMNIEKSTDARLLDRAIRNIVRRADPFPPIPEHLGDSISFSVPINFRLR